MDSKNQKIKRPKRTQKVIEDYWDCSVCTFRNTAEAFKCLMCDVRKGKFATWISINDMRSKSIEIPQLRLAEIPEIIGCKIIFSH
jgi:hypothetical protein